MTSGKTPRNKKDAGTGKPNGKPAKQAKPRAKKAVPVAADDQTTADEKLVRHMEAVSLELLDLNLVPVTGYSDEQVGDILRRAVLNLRERADLDSVRICATSQRDGKTHYYSTGVGNIYAQMGATHEWLATVDGPNYGKGSDDPDGFDDGQD